MQHATVAKQSHILLNDSTILNSISTERDEIQNNLLHIQVMNRAQTETLAFHQVTQAWQNSLQQGSKIPPRESEITQALERLYT